MSLLLSVMLAAAPEPELMKRLGEHLARLDEYEKNASFTLTVRAEELDSDNKVTHTEESVISMSQRDGKESQTLVKKTEDGKDTTAEAQKEQAKEKKDEEKSDKEKKDNKMPLPFDASEQPKYRFELMAENPKRPGLTHIAFQPAGEKSSKLMMGDALVDAATGEVVHVDMRLSKTPPFVDWFSMSVEFGATTPAGRQISNLDAAGSGGIAFVKKRARVATKFTEWRATK
jgi:hypothetical protein